ncbi:uncharacterized protein L201_003780 [Kwoniella dendrophila CBS 6074]|uniref:Uncharacterized protein n=1 Tax=Kwoniella dendrophila CBS 6074 TaxID=1295534 RepID=A0AAX4JWE0_9TREE
MKSAVLVNLTYYGRYKNRLYKYIKLNSKRDEEMKLIIGTIYNLKHRRKSRQQRRERRFKQFCSCINYLELSDEGSARCFAEILSSKAATSFLSKEYFKNVKYLILGYDLMRFSGQPDHEAMFSSTHDVKMKISWSLI